jgi:hypothetical protein
MRQLCVLVLIAAAVLGGGCVVAYDPAASARFGVGDPSPARPLSGPGRAEARAVMPPPDASSTPISAPAVAEPARTPLPPTAEAPQTAAGRQLEWVVGLLSGQQERDRAVAGHFAPDFLQRVPVAALRRTVQQWRRDELGSGPAELADVSEAEGGVLTALVRGKATDRFTQVRLGVDEQGRISTLWLAPVIGAKLGTVANWGAIDDTLASLPGSVSLAAYELPGGSSDPKAARELHTFGADKRLAIGSTSKLYIAGAVAEAVLEGRLKWDDIITIQDNLKSLPTGRMQLLAEGTEVRVADALDAMLSLSDNTAADHLMFRVGRERVEDFMRRHNGAPERNLPMLSTMELFKLKLTADRELVKRYLAADEPGRRAMLAPGGPVEQATISPTALLLWKIPFLINELEWFATAPECCEAITALHALEVKPGLEPLGRSLRVNPGIPFDARTWKSVAYKGGSEPGVLNMTWLLERADGRWFTLAIGWNDPAKAVDIQKMSELAGAAAALLADEK